MKKDLRLLVQQIKAKTKENRDVIASSIGIERETLSRKVKDNDSVTFDLLSRQYATVLDDTKKNTPEILALHASVKVLYREVAILKGLNEKISKDMALDIMKQQAAAILLEL